MNNNWDRQALPEAYGLEYIKLTLTENYQLIENLLNVIALLHTHTSSMIRLILQFAKRCCVAPKLTECVAGKICSRSLVSSSPSWRLAAASLDGRNTKRRTSSKWRKTTTTIRTTPESRKFLLVSYFVRCC